MLSLRRFCKACLAFVTLVFLVSAPALGARAAEPEEYRVRAAIERDAGRVRGHVWVRVSLGPNEDHIRLWLYPDRLAETPSTMDERSWRWIYPGEVDRGGIEVSSLRLDGARVEGTRETRPAGEARGRDFAGSDLVVPVEASAEPRTVILELDFELDVPGRFGRLGRDDGLMALAGPWYPLVVGEDDAWAFEVPHRVELTLDDGEMAVGDARFERRASVTVEGAYVPVIAAAALHDATIDVDGVELVLRTPGRLYVPPPAARRGEGGIIDLATVDVVSAVQRVAEQAIATSRAFGLELPERVVLVQIPSRTELFALAPGVVLFSDRIFQIFPIDQTLNFHRRALRRALLAHIATPLARVDPVADRGWATDLRAVALVDLDEARRRSGAETPQQLLSLLSFHPAVDQLLYAPQIAFEDAYFAAIEERDSYRDNPVGARRPLSRGRRILESARDNLEEGALRRWVAMLVNARRSARSALRRVSPRRAPRLTSWLAATGALLNYRLGEHSSERIEAGWRHTIEVFRDGAPRAEPVEIRVSDDQGNHVVGVWDGGGQRGEVAVETPGRLNAIAIDPRYRLPQSPAVADGHPRMDDATDLPWRPPILNGFLFNALVTEGDFTGLIDFALRQRYDLEHSVGLRAERTRALTGGQLRYAQGVGDKVHTNRRMGRLTAGVSFVRLHEFFGDANLGGWRGQLSLGASVNTVRFALDPRDGYWGAVGLTGGLAARDDGTLGFTFRGGARGGMVIPLGLVNAFVIVAGGGFTAGEALASELQSLGGSTRLRGFESGEMLGRGVLYAVVEHRWSAFRDLAMNLAHLVWVREIQLVVFAGAGVVFDRTIPNYAVVGIGPDGEPIPSLRHDDVLGAADVGVGVRIHYEYGGVQPGVISLDLGYPLTRTVTQRSGDPGRAPVGFYIGFDQYF